MKASNRDRIIELIDDMSEEERQTLLNDLEKKNEQDRRKYERKSYGIPTEFIAQDHRNKGMIKDISIDGALLETSEIQESFSIGETIILTITYPNQKKYIKIRGQVVRIDPQKIGVQFKKIS